MTAKEIQKELRKHVSTRCKKNKERFFKMEKGKYGYGDKFIGVSTPDSKMIAKKFVMLSFVEIKKLLQSEIHEDRATALLILVHKFENKNDLQQKKVCDFYLKNFRYVNNWDLVDYSVYKIFGVYILRHPAEAKILNTYVVSKNLWERRLAIVATLALIREGNFSWTMKNAKILLRDSHDLIHKAVGWMLREVWKRDSKLVEDFLIKNYTQVSRITLRYAIERMGKKKRKKFLYNL